MPDFNLSITICSWNTIDDLRDCLASLRAAKHEGDFEVVVVDNNSEDGSPEMVRREFPEFRLLAQSRNLGFTGGHNLALAERKGYHAALLNSDTVVHPGAIAKLSAALAEEPSWGIIGPKLLNPDGSLQFSCRTFPNPFAAAFRNTFLGRLFPQNKLTRDYLMQDWDHQSNKEVDWVSGAALFIRGDVLEKVGGLDPEFFMYCEDVDLCKRTWDAGWKVMYLHNAVITHAIGKSSDKAPNRMIGRFHRSMFRYTQKHMISLRPVWQRPFLTLLAGAALSVRAGLFIAKNQVDKLERRFKR